MVLGFEHPTKRRSGEEQNDATRLRATTEHVARLMSGADEISSRLGRVSRSMGA